MFGFNRDAFLISRFCRTILPILLETLGLIVLYSWIIVPCARAETWSNVTVVTLTGWEYANVTVESVSNDPSIVIINADGGRKKLSRSNVSVILDQKGKDITGSVLGGAATSGRPADNTVTESPAQIPARPEIGEPSKPSPSHFRQRRGDRDLLFEPRFRVSFSGGPGYSFATGEWFEGMSDGPAFNVTGRVALGRIYFLGATYRYQTVGVDPGWEGNFILYDDYGNPITVSVDFDIHFHEIFVVFGMMTEPATYTTPIGFFDIGLGSVGHSITVTATDGRDVESGGLDESKFGMIMTGGGIFPLSRSLGISLEANVRLTGQGNPAPYEYNETGSSGALIGAAVNLVLFLGR